MDALLEIESYIKDETNFENGLDQLTTMRSAILDLLAAIRERDKALETLEGEQRRLGKFMDWAKGWMHASESLSPEDARRTLDELQRVGDEIRRRIDLLRPISVRAA